MSGSSIYLYTILIYVIGEELLQSQSPEKKFNSVVGDSSLNIRDHQIVCYWN